jgi:hypothetical protein
MNLMAVFLAVHIGAISSSIGAAAGMSFFKKNCAESTIKWAALDFWDGVWEARLGKHRPHTEFSALIHLKCIYNF